MNIWDYETSVNQYNATGGTGLESVIRQIQELTEWLDKMQKTCIIKIHYVICSKTCVKRPLSKRPKVGFQDQLSLNAGQKYCRMLRGAFCNNFDLH